MISVYTDGSQVDKSDYQYSHPKNVILGAYVYVLDGLPNLHMLTFGKMINNQKIQTLELAAVVHALVVLDKAGFANEPIELATDSDYVYRGFQRLQPSTKFKMNMISKLELQFWQKLLKLKFKFSHLQLKIVKSHTDNLGNQIAHHYAYDLLQKALEAH